MLGQAFGRHPAQRFQIARLGGYEFAGEAQLAVHGGQPQFEAGRFRTQRLRRCGKPGRFAAAVAHGQQPQHRHQEHRQRPLAEPAGPLRQVGARLHGLPVDEHEQPGPAADQRHGGDKGQQREPRTPRGRFVQRLDFGFLRGGRLGLFGGGIGSRRTLRFACVDRNNARSTGHDIAFTMFGPAINPGLTLVR